MNEKKSHCLLSTKKRKEKFFHDKIFIILNGTMDRKREKHCECKPHWQNSTYVMIQKSKDGNPLFIYSFIF